MKAPIQSKLSIADAVSEAFSEITSLGDEVREAYDNTPESLQNSSIGEARDECASALEQINEPDVPEELGKIEVEVYRPSRTPKQQAKLSRRERRDDAVQIMDAVMQRLDEYLDGTENSPKQDIREEAQALRDEIELAKDEAEQVEFPGMRG